jgi:predicted tellurium resistance membrane protein TerC
MDLISNPQMWMAFVTLTILELVLGIDNIIFISILVSKLPKAKQEFARRIGLFMAMFLRVALLLLLSFIIGLVEPLFTLVGQPFSGRDLILLAGGLFLIWKSTGEIHVSLEGEHGEDGQNIKVKVSLYAIILQIMLIDLVFSLDSIITAVGMVDDVRVMIAAVVASLGLMMWFARPIGEFVDAHPSIKMLALSFLVVVGVVLVAEGFGHHVPKGYVYFAMAFSFAVELLNIRFRKSRNKPVKLRETLTKDAEL